MTRCPWAKTDRDIAYHDREWGVPLHDDRALFEFLILEGAQAGLSWSTILKKRDRYRTVFDHFDPRKVAKYNEAKIAGLLTDPGIVGTSSRSRRRCRTQRHFSRCRKSSALSMRTYGGSSRDVQ